MFVSHLSILANFSYLDNFRYDCETIFISKFGRLSQQNNACLIASWVMNIFSPDRISQFLFFEIDRREIRCDKRCQRIRKIRQDPIRATGTRETAGAERLRKREKKGEEGKEEGEGGRGRKIGRPKRVARNPLLSLYLQVILSLLLHGSL